VSRNGYAQPEMLVKTEWVAEHQAISVSVCSNIPGFEEPKCFVNANLHKLVHKMVAYLLKIQLKAAELVGHDLAAVKDQVDEMIAELQDDDGEPMDDDDDMPQRPEDLGDDDMEEKKKKTGLEMAKDTFTNYIRQLPVLGFNSAKYDLQLVKKTLAQVLQLDRNGYCIKKGNAYTSLGMYRVAYLNCGITIIVSLCRYYMCFLTLQAMKHSGF
jgi:hypothetical protein